MEEGRVLSERIWLLESSKAHENLAVKEVPICADALASMAVKGHSILQKLSPWRTHGRMLRQQGPPSVRLSTRHSALRGNTASRCQSLTEADYVLVPNMPFIRQTIPQTMNLACPGSRRERSRSAGPRCPRSWLVDT